MHPMINIALRAARSAGEQAVRAIERLDLMKAEQENIAKFVSETCISMERNIAATIQKAYPQHRVIGEFSGTHNPLEGEGEFEWHINPVDNIASFSKALPYFALCITGKDKGKATHALIINPMMAEEFTASLGKGAQLNGRRLRVSQARTLEQAAIGTGYFNRSSDKGFFQALQNTTEHLIASDCQLHYCGSPALSIAYTAAGRLDGYFQFGLNSAEIDAALLILQESGGLSCDLEGNSNVRQSGNVIAASPKMLKQLIQGIRKPQA
ncbi:MAG: inositol monophosphatase family protein [Pontibacterium sp.]